MPLIPIEKEGKRHFLKIYNMPLIPIEIMPPIVYYNHKSHPREVAFVVK